MKEFIRHIPAFDQKYQTSKFGRLVSVPVTKETRKHFNATHGLTKTKEYQAWARIKSRCYNINSEDYPDYGGRGITMCDEWCNSFMAFYQHVGKAPGSQFSIDRIDNGGNYEPGNVRWATPYQQARNKRNNTLLEYKGEKKTLGEWCEDLKLPTKRTQNRITKGWPVAEAFDHKSYKYTKRPHLLKKSSNRSKDHSAGGSDK